MGTLERALGNFFRRFNKLVVWYRLPFLLAMLNLIALRINLRRFNLHDMETDWPAVDPPGGLDHRVARSDDGRFNDLASPAMGMTGTRFGRNAKIDQTYGERDELLLTPNPREVSLKLLTREEFIPATTLNILAAGWIQFMVHDWFSHGKNDKDNPIEVPVPDGDSWHEDPMTVLRTTRAPRTEADAGRPEAFVNTETHWWDGSQIYGSTAERVRRLRSGPDGQLLPDGKLQVKPDGHLPLDEKGIELTGVNGNWWIGLSVLHTLFTREHNAICDRLKIDYPEMSGDMLFAKARLINAALMAKIHTVEWTPALLDTPELRFGMRGNWWGALGEEVYRRFGRVSESEVFSGIPGSATDHHTAPYAMTEEFVTVYRMHELLPDELSFRARADDAPLKDCTLIDVAGAKTHGLYDEVSYCDAMYSLGTSHPGAITLHNFPRHLQTLTRQDSGRVVDLGTIDILRDRERGVPRYNAFRKMLDMKPFKSFEELTGNAAWAAQIREVYDGDIDAVDTHVGMMAERLPPGFGFSDTAFRIFILMASRRLKSDRFYTTDYTPAVYTPVGIDWIDENGMRSVLLRHLPDLAPHVAGLRNVFFPWRRGGA